MAPIPEPQGRGPIRLTSQLPYLANTLASQGRIEEAIEYLLLAD